MGALRAVLAAVLPVTAAGAFLMATVLVLWSFSLPAGLAVADLLAAIPPVSEPKVDDSSRIYVEYSALGTYDNFKVD